MTFVARLGLCLAFFSSTASVVEGAKVRFRATATVRGSIVFLKDVAEIEADSVAQKDKLSWFRIGPAPSKRTVLDGPEIARRVRAANLGQIHFSGAKRITISRGIGGTTQTKIVPAAQQKFFALAVRRPLAAGHVLTVNDLGWKRVVKLPRATITPKQAIGRELRRFLRQGDVLSRADLKSIPLVRIGDRVTVESRFGAVTIRGDYIARSSGRYGDVVRLESTKADPRKRHTITGTVVGLREVELNTKQPAKPTGIRIVRENRSKTPTRSKPRPVPTYENPR